MPLIRVWDVPEHLHRRLAQQAEKERRTLAQQVVVVLARGLQVDLDAKARRKKVLDAIHASDRKKTGKLSDPAKLIREDRRR